MENLNIGELFNESIKTIILQEVKNSKERNRKGNQSRKNSSIDAERISK